MGKRGFLLLVLGLLIGISSSLPAAAAFELGSRRGTDAGSTISGFEVQLDYTSEGGSSRQATANVASEITVSTIYGYDPAWSVPPTFGIEPGETSTYSYQIFNAGNDSQQFTVTYSVLSYVSSVAGDWTCSVSTESILLPRGTASSEFQLTLAGSTDISPGAKIVVSLNVECDGHLDATSYTGDNGYTYGGYGDADQTVTTTILVARLSLTKTVTVNAPATYVANGGNADAAVPGALLTYSVGWDNIGSLPADNVVLIDLLPSQNAILTGNVTTVNAASIATTISYYYSDGWQSTPSHNAGSIKVEYDSIPISATGNITYQLIIK